MKKFVALAVVGMMIAGQASAAAAGASVTSVSGSVMASQSGKFAPVAAGAALSAGDRVVASDGTAQVKFADGCVVSVKPQAMLTVGPASPCATGSGLVSASNSTPAQFGDDPDGYKKSAATFLILSALLWAAAQSRDNGGLVYTVSP